MPMANALVLEVFPAGQQEGGDDTTHGLHAALMSAYWSS